MELRNKTGDVTQLADSLTLKEVAEMGFTIDLCDEAFDPAEHWQSEKTVNQKRSEFPSDD